MALRIQYMMDTRRSLWRDQGYGFGLGIADPDAPVEIGSLDLPGLALGVDAAGSMVYVAAKEAGLRVKILGQPELTRMGLRSLMAVNRGSVAPPRVVHLTYSPARKRKTAPRIVLVGKGVTFDSGGISLKPGPAMDEMKFDMCGAASVIGAMVAVAKLQLPVNLNVVVPAVENLPSGVATKPGDIVKWKPIGREEYDQTVADVEANKYTPLIRDVEFALGEFENDIDAYNKKLEEVLYA